MINGLEGIPGSGKSYEAVAYHVLPALRAGRRVITNLPLNVDRFAAIDPHWRDLIEIRTSPAPRLGDWNAADIAQTEAFRLWTDRPPAPQPENVFTFGTVWDFHSTWRGEGGQGPLYVIDECHVAFPKSGTPDEVVQWFKLHRHFNADVLLMTQSFRDINQPIAQLIATLIKCRKADILGKSDHYIRKVHAGYRGAQIQVDERKYKAEYFGLYRSNTQSGGSAESGVQDVSPMIVQFNRFKWAWMALTMGALGYAFWPQDDANVWGVKQPPKTAQQAPRPTPLPQSTQATPQTQQHQAHPNQQTPQPHAQTHAQQVPKEPLFGKSIHITGFLKMGERFLAHFSVSEQGRLLFDLTSDDLKQAGYKVAYLGQCMISVQWDGGDMRHVTCDAPYMQSGRQDRPIVIDSRNGYRSDQSSNATAGDYPQDAPRTVPVPLPSINPRTGDRPIL